MRSPPRMLANRSTVKAGNYHTVLEGECLSSIGEQTGHFWETLWNHPSNADLAKRRGDPNVLAPGDQVFVPDLREKCEMCATQKRHHFRRRGVPAHLRMQFWYAGEPRAGHRCEVTVDGVARPSFALDGEGSFDLTIPCTAREARVVLGEGQVEETVSLLLGQLAPATMSEGVRARLLNLGRLDGDATDEEVAASVRAFQDEHGLAATGTVDDATRARLVEIHGS